MPVLQHGVVAIPCVFADPAAAASETDLVAFGLPDNTDLTAIVMPMAGTIIGLSVTGKPASGDTVTVTPRISATPAAGGANAASLATQITNAAPAAYTVVSKDQADAQFSAGQCISLRYVTTTSGSYTTRDLHVTLWIATSRTDV